MILQHIQAYNSLQLSRRAAGNCIFLKYRRNRYRYATLSKHKSPLFFISFIITHSDGKCSQRGAHQPVMLLSSMFIMSFVSKHSQQQMHTDFQQCFQRRHPSPSFSGCFSTFLYPVSISCWYGFYLPTVTVRSLRSSKST